MRTARTTEDQPVIEQIAAEVRAEMARQGLSQAKLATKLGWTQPRLSRRVTPGKNGLIPFTAAELLAVADKLGAPIAQFLPTAEAAR